MLQNTIPILRIFDEAKAREYYIDWLEFKVDWEHRFEENAPLYMQISRDDIKIHLTEHYGDCTPGARIYIVCNALQLYCDELSKKKCKYYHPATEKAFYGALCMELTDPFGNRLSFNEEIK